MDIRDLYPMIQEIIEEETIYLRHYIGEVVNVLDISKKGRIQITIPDLGLDTPDKAVWCFPRQGHSLSVPKIKSYAEVYFINGDRMKPVYIYPASEISGNTPTAYSGIVDTHILYESPKKGDTIKHNDITGLFAMKNTATSLLIELNLLNNAVIALQQAMGGGWVVVPTDGGQALKTALATFLSLTLPTFEDILSET